MTVGVSPKAKLAAVFTALATVLSTIAVALITGAWDTAAIATAVTGLIGTVSAFAGAFIGYPGDVVTAVGQASDEALSPDVAAKLESGKLTAVEPD